MTEISIRPFASADAQAFRDLNLAWLNAYFHVEPKDEATLANPQETVLAPGGAIFAAELDGAVVGCVALLPMASESYEVAKMAVTPEVQGRGVGRLLLEKVVASPYARADMFMDLWLTEDWLTEEAARTRPEA